MLLPNTFTQIILINFIKSFIGELDVDYGRGILSIITSTTIKLDKLTKNNNLLVFINI